jgi:hypothetical protein
MSEIRHLDQPKQTANDCAYEEDLDPKFSSLAFHEPPEKLITHHAKEYGVEYHPSDLVSLPSLISSKNDPAHRKMYGPR